MGVLLEPKDQTVLKDGLHKNYTPAYTYPSNTVIASLLKGNYPGFSDIELSIIPHDHKDHYNPELRVAFFLSLIIQAQLNRTIAKNWDLGNLNAG
ncbi:hypothetical protein [Arenibacter lacus]|uniref:hypothetical protein n=1 Tax=Arenibacter lacus TaxID=2608629 RepID=UPI00123CC71B|nr:hypothetical protein [Arenibacter lacus]